jgi:tetratricopeptide (TPR) repeat protein
MQSPPPGERREFKDQRIKIKEIKVLKEMKMIKGIWSFLLLIIFLLAGCQGSSKPSLPAEKKRELANALYNQELYIQAISEYQEYLRLYPLDEKEQANISYQIANIYFDRLKDYQNALAYFIRAKHLNPESNLQSQISKNIVECLERLNRSTDARQVIARSSALDESQKPESQPGEVIARIGEREITTGDLAFQINQLPEYLRGQVQSPEQKKELLRQYIARELLYDSAKRMGLERDQEVIEGVFQAKKALMTEKLLEQEIEKEINLENYTNTDVETYYKANQEKYAEKDESGNVKRLKPFSEVAQQTAQDFIREKRQEAYQRIIERLMKAEQVVIYDAKLN